MSKPAAHSPNPAPSPSVDPQLAAFDQAMQLFHSRNFAAALPLFEKAAQGAQLDVKQTALLHARMCQQRIQAANPVLQTADDYFTHGVTLLNQRRLPEAETVLAKAIAMAPRADQTYYALALTRGLQGNYRGAAESLARAIELQPSNRSAARQDAEFREVLKHSPIRELVYSETIAGH